MKIQLIRHATLLLHIDGNRILVDPMLSGAGAMPAVPGVANTQDNPLVALPIDPSLLMNMDAILLTHTHRDHFDVAAMEVLPKNIPLFCQPEDADKIAAAGFKNIQTINEATEWEGIHIYRTGGQHGTGSIGESMGPVSGFILEAQDQPSLYICGDTIWCPEVESALEKYQPRIIVCFAGAARFSGGDPITMDKEDIVNVCRQAPDAKVIVVHMEAWNHCALSRGELGTYVQQELLGQQVYIPDNGEEMSF